jgi:hypothetical protein
MTDRLAEAVEKCMALLFELYHGKPYSEKDPDFIDNDIEEDLTTITPVLRELCDMVDAAVHLEKEAYDRWDKTQKEIDRLTAENEQLKANVAKFREDLTMSISRNMKITAEMEMMRKKNDTYGEKND